MAASTEHGERLARLEGAYEHLATKADIERLKSEIIKWFIGTALALTIAASAVAAVIATWVTT